MSMGQIQLEADELWQQLVRITNDYTLERNIYALDKINRSCQKVLGLMEYTMEGRPLESRLRLLDKTR
jgi:hypothetical protein